MDQNPTAETHHNWHAKRTQKVGSEMAGNEGVLPYQPRAGEAGTPFYEVNCTLEVEGLLRCWFLRRCLEACKACGTRLATSQ